MDEASEEYQITWLIRRLFRAMGQASTDSIANLGVTAADRAVMEFLYRDGPLSVPEIAKRYQVSRQHVQVTVNPLIDKKMLVAKPNPRHKRSPLIALSPKGKTLFAKIRARDERIVERMFSGISDRDRSTTRRTLERLYDRISEGGHS